MKRSFLAVTAAAVLALLTTAHAQDGPDGLQCYKIRDADLRGLRGVVDLDAPSLGLAAGCKLGKAKLYCTPARQAVQPGTLYDGNTPLTELPYHGPPAATDRVCYRVSCPKPAGTASAQQVTDRFGTRRLTALKTDMLCLPATGGTLPPPASGLQLESPEIEIQPQQNVQYCYYFRFPNAEKVAVKRFASSMRAVNRKVALFRTTDSQGVPVDALPPGTVSTVDCSALGSQGVKSHWMYEADTPDAELALPDDDGAGNPLALEVPAFSSGFMMIHHHNTTNEVQKGRVTINLEALDEPVYTRTDTITAIDTNFAVPPYTTGYVQTNACDVPPGSKFWRLTTHTHKFASVSSVADGPETIFETLDWTHPGGVTWPAPPFRSFASGKLTHGCTFDNPNGFIVRAGSSYQFEDECVAVGYFFPATQPLSCRDGYPH